MATLNQIPAPSAQCLICGSPARVSVESPTYHAWEPNVFKAPIITVDYPCNCRPHQYSNTTNLSIAKEKTVTEKQYSTDATKNDRLKDVAARFKAVETQLLANAFALQDLHASNQRMLDAELKALDHALLKAGQSDMNNEEIADAFPDDSDVLVARLEAIWETVGVDFLEKIS